MPHQVRKPWFKRWWVWVAAVLALGLLANLGDDRPVPLGSNLPTAATSVDDPATEESEESATESDTAEETTTAPEKTKAPKPPKKVYRTLSTRQFKLLAKDPDAYVGKTYVIYGEVTQFDSATGEDTFRANTGAKKKRVQYGFVDYSQNTMLTGDADRLADLVEGDCFKARVTVIGSLSYDTQLGGNTTVPQFRVDSIKVYDNTDD